MQEHSSDHRPYADEGEVIASMNAIRNEIAANRRDSKEQLDRIEAQTVKTNGRVTALEAKVGAFELWKAELRGIAQGSGGAGKLVLYILGGGASFTAILVGLLSITDHLK